MGRGSFFGTTAIAIATVVLSTTGLSAQDAGPTSPKKVTLGLGTRVLLDSNRNLDWQDPGSTFEVAEELSFGIISESGGRSLDFFASTELLYTNEPKGTSFGFDNPRARLSYFNEAANADINLTARYSFSSVSDSLYFGDSTSDDLSVDEGDVAIYSASLGFRVGTSDPVGFGFDASFFEREYYDTIDPDLSDYSARSLGLSALFTFSPTTNGSFSTIWDASETDNFEQLEKESFAYSFDITHELRRALSLDASIGYRFEDTTEFGFADRTEGIIGSLGAVQQVGNGSVYGDIDYDHSDSEDVVEMTVGRSYDLDDGFLSASLTLRDGSESGTQLLGSFDYLKELRNGSVNAYLSQDVAENEDDEDVKYSTLGFGYTQGLTQDSDMNLSLQLSRSEDGGRGAVDQHDRADFTASYSRDLTPDWDLSLGYRYRMSDEEGLPQAKSNALFFNLTRNIALGF